jgi:hypothetical protein
VRIALRKRKGGGCKTKKGREAIASRPSSELFASFSYRTWMRRTSQAAPPPSARSDSR